MHTPSPDTASLRVVLFSGGRGSSVLSQELVRDRRIKLRRPGADGNMGETDAKPQDVVKADDVIFVKEALF